MTIMILMFFYAITCGLIIIIFDDISRFWKSAAVIMLIFFVYVGSLLREQELANDEEKKPYKVLINNEMKIIQDTLILTEDNKLIKYNDSLQVFNRKNEKW